MEDFWKVVKKLPGSMAFNIIGAIVFLLGLFGAIAATLGMLSYTRAFISEYSTTTYHIADTAATLVNGDHLDEYLAGGEIEEYQRSKRYLEGFCKRMHVTMFYVIQVDTSDYGRFVSIFNPINNEIDDSSYTEWEIGHRRDTTNNEYREKYRAIYEKKADYETVFRTKPTDGQHPHITTMVPVMDAAGEVAGILCVQRPISEINKIVTPFLERIGVTAFLLAVLSGLIAAIFIRRYFINPIVRVSDEATRFAHENTKGEPLGRLSRYEEIFNLARLRTL